MTRDYIDSKFVCKLASAVIYLATESIFHFYGYQDGSSHKETSKKLHLGNFLKASLVGAKKPFISRLSGSFSRPISSSFSQAEGPWDDVSSASLSSKAIHAFDRKRQIQRGNKTKGKRAKRLQCLVHSN